LDAELYATCPGERVLVVMTHQVQYNIPTFEASLRKNMHLFLERCTLTVPKYQIPSPNEQFS